MKKKIKGYRKIRCPVPGEDDVLKPDCWFLKDEQITEMRLMTPKERYEGLERRLLPVVIETTNNGRVDCFISSINEPAVMDEETGFNKIMELKQQENNYHYKKAKWGGVALSGLVNLLEKEDVEVLERIIEVGIRDLEEGLKVDKKWYSGLKDGGSKDRVKMQIEKDVKTLKKGWNVLDKLNIKL